MTADQPIDVQRFIDARGLSLVQVLLLVLCFIVVAVDGFDIVAIGFIAPAIRTEWGLTPASLRPVRGRARRAHDRRLRLRPARRPARPPGDPRPHGPLLRRGQPRLGLRPLDRDAHPAPVCDWSWAGRRVGQCDHPRLGILPGGPPLVPRVDRVQWLRLRRHPGRRGGCALDCRV